MAPTLPEMEGMVVTEVYMVPVVAVVDLPTEGRQGTEVMALRDVC